MPRFVVQTGLKRKLVYIENQEVCKCSNWAESRSPHWPNNAPDFGTAFTSSRHSKSDPDGTESRFPHELGRAPTDLARDSYQQRDNIFMQSSKSFRLDLDLEELLPRTSSAWG